MSFNAIASNLQSDTFIQRRLEGKTAFIKEYGEIAKRQLELLPYGNADWNQKTYGEGNIAFANGASFMYIQGSWAIPEIKKANPEIELGIFPFPATDDQSNNRLVSGIDSLITVSRSSEHPSEAKAFLNFLLESENVKNYLSNQNAIATEENMHLENPIFDDLNDAFQRKAIVDYADHSLPNEMLLEQIVQKFLFKGNIEDYLTDLDNAWDSTH
ncbi:ABC transporter substrate-binding protein [Paenibacillus hexagrammi]|uniref:ABC transporter substrate-binding protein n=1 Tax=Paenibacillus hexagrammi TaxID=2908839 RepID=UPI0021A8D9D9|nr:extracellular solute-binding protein [Paenibacillus sp. YPD9-1]